MPALRDVGALAVSLVAERDRKVVGHVACTLVTISNGAQHWYGLGQLAVEPALRCQNIGSRLVRAGLAQLRAISAEGCVVLGVPAYYSRFGFTAVPGLVYLGAPPEAPSKYPPMSSDAVEVRLLGATDLAVLDRVAADVFDFTVQRALAEEYLSTPGNLLAVATLSGVVVGMASAIAYIHPDKPLQLFINEVGGVSERVRGQGIGKRLMRALLEQGRLIGCTEAWVATEVSNTVARALYGSFAGTEDQDHAVVYTWRLGNPLAGANIGDV